MQKAAAALPLRRHSKFASSDLDAFRTYLSKSYCDHRVVKDSTRDGLDAGTTGYRFQACLSIISSTALEWRSILARSSRST